MPFPGIFKRYFPPRTPCCFVGIHARLGTMPSKCPRPAEAGVGGGGGGGGGERDEVWDRETMFSQLAKRSPSVVYGE